MQNKKEKAGKGGLPPYVAPSVEVLQVLLEECILASLVNPSVTDPNVKYIDYDEIEQETSAGRDVLIL